MKCLICNGFELLVLGIPTLQVSMGFLELNLGIYKFYDQQSFLGDDCLQSPELSTSGSG
jgi:hypothetical protein